MSEEIGATANNEEEILKPPESPKPLAFTIDFGNGKSFDQQRHKTFMDKFQKKHRRGQSMSKLEEATSPAKQLAQPPLTCNLPRKSSFQSEGYFSSDEKPERLVKSANAKRADLNLPLKNSIIDKLFQNLSSQSPDIELCDISSPDLVPTSPFTPEDSRKNVTNLSDLSDENQFVDGAEFEFDKSDTLSETGTYTLDADNYSEEQKARMSIDADFKIEQVSVLKKTEDYVRNLLPPTGKKVEEPLKSAFTGGRRKINSKVLSPILSPTQNFSVTQTIPESSSSEKMDDMNRTFTKILSLDKPKVVDAGSVISVTSSGAFRSKADKKHERKYSLTKSEIQVEAYIAGSDCLVTQTLPKPTLTANIVNVQNLDVKEITSRIDDNAVGVGVVTASLVFGKLAPVITPNLPPCIGGKTSPSSKIPSPIHTLSRPRSRNSLSSLTDATLENTEILLKPTQNYINTLQQRLSLDSDPDSDFDSKYGIQLNNTAHLMKQKASHTRHNSLDDRTMNNKLEHFQTKNLQGIDQTYSNVLYNQYNSSPAKLMMHKIQNSPNNSPIKRSSSFSTKNQINAKNTNITQKDKNNILSPLTIRHIHRSSSTTTIQPTYKIDRSQFGDTTESSSEEDFDKTLQKRKDLTNITNTRCNRAFSLRRGRLEEPLKCPNTPEMRRKHPTEMRAERAISVDRKPMKTEVPSRYLQNITKRSSLGPAKDGAGAYSATTPDRKLVPKNVASITPKVNKPQSFARTDSGRFSMRAGTKPPLSNQGKSSKKDGGGKKSNGGRSNSSLSSREVEFQNWKRRKSYDPMKAAAEGKKKEMAKRQSQNVMTQSYTESNHSQDSSPSHSSSVHRSQSFHGTAALGHQLLSSDEDDDLTLSADEGFSPPTPSPCELSPARASLRHSLWEKIHH